MATAKTKTTLQIKASRDKKRSQGISSSKFKVQSLGFKVIVSNSNLFSNHSAIRLAHSALF
jgi:hypothetical protein